MDKPEELPVTPSELQQSKEVNVTSPADVKPIPAKGRPFFEQVIIGFVAYLILMLLTIVVFASTNSPLAVLILLLFLIGLFLPARRGYVVGFLIGLGLTALAFGLCFAGAYAFR